ncbi:hypothetical protein [Geminicoccus roseus]|uniref:hypothetical protein n=1 Tax=Geminicoccus roseus TaxID=404900 RepID=UPI000414E196|nr:hypothetical protein [Geminicoccus roseus]
MTQVMTAVYDTRGAAEAAHGGLRAMGIAEQEILLRSAEEQGQTPDTSAGSGPTGFWRNLFEIFIPQSEHPTYLEGMRRGAFMVAVQVPDGREHEVEQLLESHDPINLDEDDQASHPAAEGAVAGMGGASVAGTAGTGGKARRRVRNYSALHSSGQ